MIRWLAPLALLLTATGCAASDAPTATMPTGQQRPALWSVADDDTTIYLFGTVHLLPEGLDWRTEAFDRAFAAADTLVLEVDLPRDPAAQAQTMAGLAFAPNLPPLVERVPAGQREALAALIAGSGFPVAALDRMKTWAAAVTLGSTLYRDSGLSPERGVERVLQAAAGDKRIVGLETVEQQLGFFDALSEETQRTLLVSLVGEAGNADGVFAELLTAWGTGDQAAIVATYEEATNLSPEVADALLDRRNAAWTDWIAARLASTPGTVMMAVGAGHLAGDGSVIARLEAAGLTVRRVQ